VQGGSSAAATISACNAKRAALRTDRHCLLEARAALTLKSDRAAVGVSAALDTAAAALAVLEERVQHTHCEVHAGRLDGAAAAAALAPLLAQVRDRSSVGSID
jgi:hypothetical protein